VWGGYPKMITYGNRRILRYVMSKRANDVTAAEISWIGR
jgi:hypothetical protein